MNEKAPINSNVIPFRNREAQLEKMSDGEVIAHFLTELRHPGAPRGRSKLAEHILKLTGQNEPDSDAARFAWYERMRRIGQGVPLSDSVWDSLVDPTNDEYDPAFAALVTGLQRTRGNEDLALERDAMLGLLDLRVASLRCRQYDEEPEHLEAQLYDSEYWVNLAEILSDPTNPVQSDDNDKL